MFDWHIIRNSISYKLILHPCHFIYPAEQFGWPSIDHWPSVYRSVAANHIPEFGGIISDLELHFLYPWILIKNSHKSIVILFILKKWQNRPTGIAKFCSFPLAHYVVRYVVKRWIGFNETWTNCIYRIRNVALNGFLIMLQISNYGEDWCTYV